MHQILVYVFSQFWHITVVCVCVCVCVRKLYFTVQINQRYTSHQRFIKTLLKLHFKSGIKVV